MADKPYMVFTCNPDQEIAHTDEPDDKLIPQDWWEAHGPIPAASGDKAIEKLREMAPELKVLPVILYFAVANMRPKKMRRRFIERYELDFADEPDDGEPTKEMER